MEKKSLATRMLLIGALTSGIGLGQSYFNEVQGTGTGNPPAKTHTCVRVETSPTHATLDCIGGGTRCAGVSDC